MVAQRPVGQTVRGGCLNRPEKSPAQQVVVISDLHAGCQLALCPPSGARLDNGGTYMPGPVQRRLWPIWLDFRKWVDQVTGGKPFDPLADLKACDAFS